MTSGQLDKINQLSKRCGVIQSEHQQIVNDMTSLAGQAVSESDPRWGDLLSALGHKLKEMASAQNDLGIAYEQIMQRKLQ